MTTILHAGIFRDHELGGDIVFGRGFEENGCGVEQFDYRSIDSELGRAGMLAGLIDRARGKDLLFIGKGERMSPEALAAVRRGGTAVALWYGDMRNTMEPWLKALLPQVDFLFMSSGGAILRQYFTEGRPGLAAYYFNPANPALFAKYSQPREKDIPVLFTGTTHLPGCRLRQETIAYLARRPDVTFFGGAERLARKERPTVLRRLMSTRESSTPVLRGEAYIDAIRRAMVGVGVNFRQDVDKYTSDRLTHYLTFGTFFLPCYFPGLELLFRRSTEVVWYTGVEDLAAKIDYYLAHAEQREAIAAAARRRITTEYCTANMVAMILEITRTGTSSRFPWVEIYR